MTGAGKNTVEAGRGDDLIFPEGIKDKVWTGNGDDIVVIGRNSNSKKSATQIMDFDAEGDMIVLRIGKYFRHADIINFTQNFSGKSGEVVVENKSRHTQLIIDTSGNGQADHFVKVFGDDSLSITPENFEMW